MPQTGGSFLKGIFGFPEIFPRSVVVALKGEITWFGDHRKSFNWLYTVRSKGKMTTETITKGITKLALGTCAPIFCLLNHSHWLPVASNLCSVSLGGAFVTTDRKFGLRREKNCAERTGSTG